ncbi:MAG: hypothetical protein KDC92_15800, partial [Bacteroidetes bacterium]|nr:hypothetical protein [Bacteroidota bacterium]
NIAKPRAALDVRGSNVYNRPAALIGARAMGTELMTGSGLWQYQTQGLLFVPKLANNGYNQISQQNDQGIFYTDGKGSDGANLDGDLVIAPWVENNDPNKGGMRMDKDGNTEFHGTLK